jgi:hypothetical protein
MFNLQRFFMDVAPQGTLDGRGASPQATVAMQRIVSFYSG